MLRGQRCPPSPSQLDYYLQGGFTPAHPVSVELGGNVADYVVRDLAEWIQRVAP